MKPASYYREKVLAQMTAYLTQRDAELNDLLENELRKIEEALDSAVKSFCPTAPKPIYVYRQYTRRELYVKVFDALKTAGYEIVESNNGPGVKIQIIVPIE